MSFIVGADEYDRFMGRYSAPLAPQFADFAAVDAGKRVLDVGCGPGALTAVLVRRLGPGTVSAVDPSEPFVAAAQERHPGVSVQRAAAEELPFEDRAFDAALAQLVVHFMAHPVVGLREMARVTRKGGVVAACVWDHSGGQGPLNLFWQAARELDPDVEGESQLAGAREGHLGELFRAAGLREIEESALTVGVEHPSFEEWWEPFTLGVGPAGAYAAGLDAKRQTRLRELCRDRGRVRATVHFVTLCELLEPGTSQRSSTCLSRSAAELGALRTVTRKQHRCHGCHVLIRRHRGAR